MTLLFIAAVAGLVVVVGGLSYIYMGEDQQPYDGPNDNQNGDDPNAGLQLAPDFTLPKVGGGSISLSSLRGKVVLLDFMSTTCPPCETQIEILKGINMEFSNAELNIFSISSGDSESTLSQYMSSKGVTWSFLMDNTGVSQMPGYDVKYIPTIVIINQDGYIEHWNQGVISSSELSDIIRPLL